MALAHFAALYAAWGADRMDAWLKQLKANEPQLYDNDDQVREAVVSGRAIVGLVASDEAAKASASAAHVLAVYPNQKSIGTFVWPTALSVPKSAKNPDSAHQLAARSPLPQHVAVAAAGALAQQISALLQLGDDPLHGAFGDADPIGHFAQRDRWVLRDATQDVEMIGQETPRRLAHAVHPAPAGDPVQKITQC